jgi:hypothetical protein
MIPIRSYRKSAILLIIIMFITNCTPSNNPPLPSTDLQDLTRTISYSTQTITNIYTENRSPTPNSQTPTENKELINTKEIPFIEVHSPLFELPTGNYIIYSDRECEIIALSYETNISTCLIRGVTGISSLSPDGKWIFMCADDPSLLAPINPIFIELDKNPEIIQVNDKELCPNQAIWSPDSTTIGMLRGLSITLLNVPSGELIYKSRVINLYNTGPEPERYIYFGTWSPNNRWIAYRYSLNWGVGEPTFESLYITKVSCLKNPNCSDQTFQISQLSFTDIFAWTSKSELAIYSNEEKILRFYNVEDGSVTKAIYNLPFAKIDVMSFSNDGNYLAIIDYDGILSVLSLIDETVSTRKNNTFYVYEWLSIK